MFVNQQLEDLELRKRALISRSAVQRAMLQVECVRLQPYLECLDTGAKIAKKARPIWLAGAGLLGLLLTARAKKLRALLPTAFVAWKAVKKGLAIWRIWHESPEPDSTPETSAVAEEG